MIGQSEILMDKIDSASTSDKVVDFYPLMCNYALDMICETAMGEKIDAQTNKGSRYVKAVENLTSIIFNRLKSPWLYNNTLFELSPLGRELRKNRDIIHMFIKDVVAKRKKEF